MELWKVGLVGGNRLLGVCPGVLCLSFLLLLLFASCPHEMSGFDHMPHHRPRINGDKYIFPPLSCSPQVTCHSHAKSN
jgi:hypothetical protein